MTPPIVHDGRRSSFVRSRFEAAKATAVLALSVRCCLAFTPTGIVQRSTKTVGPGARTFRWTGGRPLAAAHRSQIARASAPLAGDYDYTYDHGGDRMTHPSDQAGVDRGTDVPAGETSADTHGGAEGGTLEAQEAPRRIIGISQLFRRPGAAGLKSNPPGRAWRVGVQGMVPVAAAIGLSLTPSRYLAARAAGGVVLALAANVAKEAAMATRKRQAPEALLELVRREGAGNITREQLLELGEKYMLKEPQLWESSSLLYSSILSDTVADHEPNTDDLGRLVMLKWTLGLDPREVAACHQMVIADALGSVGLPVSMDKMIYLSERMFYQEGMTDAGYLDQCARLRNQLGGMTQVELLRKVTQYAAPRYQDVLDDVISRPENFSGEVLLRTRRRLGISEVVAGGMHLDIYQSAIQGILNTHGKLDEEDRAWLGRLRGIMGVSQFEGERALESVTAPVYREVVQAAFAEAAGLTWGQPGVDSLRSKLSARQGDLQLSMAAADAVVKETVRKLALRSLEAALIALRNGGGGSPEGEVLRAMGEVFRLRDSAALLVQNSPNADCSRYFVGVLVGSPSLRLTESEKRSIFRVHVQDALKDMRLDEGDKATLACLGDMLQLPETECRKVFLHDVHPLLAQRLAGMMEHGDFTAQDVAKLEEDLTVPHDIFVDICMEVYHARLTKILEDTGKSRSASSMHSDIEKAGLESIAEALDLSREQLYTIHDITCGPAFKGAAEQLLREAEEGQGVVEQAEPVILVLESLRARLGMSTDGARAAFVGAFYEVASPKVKQISTAIEALKDAREMIPPTAPSGSNPIVSPPPPPTGPQKSTSTALAESTPNGGDTNGASPVPPGAIVTSGGGGGYDAASAAGGAGGRNQEGLSHAQRLEVRAAGILERVLELVALCDVAGASNDLEVALAASGTGRVDPLYSANVGQTVAPKAALAVYNFFLEEAFSPSRDSVGVDDALVQKRRSLALVLGLTKARVIDVHRGAASRLFLAFLQGRLERNWTLDAVGVASLKAMEEELGMTRVVCEELLSRGKKSFVRQRVEAAGPRAMDDPSSARALRECATSLGVSLRHDLALPEQRRRRMFEAEGEAVLREESDAAAAKATVEQICLSLGLPDGAVYDLYAKLPDLAEAQQGQGQGSDDTVVVVSGRATERRSGDSSADGEVGGGGRPGVTGRGGVANPATFATSE